MSNPFENFDRQQERYQNQIKDAKDRAFSQSQEAATQRYREQSNSFERQKIAELQRISRTMQQEIEFLKQQNEERKKEAEEDRRISRKRYAISTGISLFSAAIALGSLAVAIIALLF